jgi:hypothetical protein
MGKRNIVLAFPYNILIIHPFRGNKILGRKLEGWPGSVRWFVRGKGET